ncbi:CPBP family intramembrane glutamic endopeptidase [Streptomyces sp. NPDC050636]|uniref:CPBP family intramembrane glutamic endopeptidase n=1 Tax=Streptomyces sp. NPDC050636 TaxID=3154510 RepID=UPI00342291A2
MYKPGATTPRIGPAPAVDTAVPPGTGRVVLLYLGLFLADALLSTLAGIAGEPITQGLDRPLWSPRGAAASALSDLVVFGGLLALLAVWVILCEHRPLTALGLGTPQRGREFTSGCLLGLVIAVGALIVTAARGWTAMRVSVPASTLIAFAPLWMTMSTFQAGVEEIIFRGWMLPLLARRWHISAAVLIQAVLFSCLHLLVSANTTLAVIHSLAFGVFAGLYTLHRSGIWGVIGIHGAYNFATILVISVSADGQYGAFAWHYTAIALTGVGATVMLILFRRRPSSAPDKFEGPP